MPACVRNPFSPNHGSNSTITGRSQATAGIITGIIGVSICALATLFIVLAIIAGIASTGI